MSVAGIERLYTVEQIGEAVGRKPQFVRAKIRAGEIPALLVGDEYRIKESAYVAWLDSCEHDGSPIAARQRKSQRRGRGRA